MTSLSEQQPLAPSGRRFRKRKPQKVIALPAPQHSSWLYVRVAPAHVGMFRFLLEAHDNIALFTVLDRHEALLRVMFSPHQEAEARTILEGMNDVICVTICDTPI